MTGRGALVRPALPRQRAKKAARGRPFRRSGGGSTLSRRSAKPFARRRWAPKPRPANPKAIIAQVDGSGAGAAVNSTLSRRANGGNPGSVGLQVFPGIRHVPMAKNESVSFASVAVKVRLFENQPVKPPSTVPSPIEGERLDGLSGSLAGQLVRLTVLSAQTSTLDASAN
jgi:hypothetical protein